MNVYEEALKRARQLNRSERGRTCLRALQTFFEHSDRSMFCLDSQNQRAVIELMSAFALSAHSTIDAIEEVLA